MENAKQSEWDEAISDYEQKLASAKKSGYGALRKQFKDSSDIGIKGLRGP